MQVSYFYEVQNWILYRPSVTSFIINDHVDMFLSLGIIDIISPWLYYSGGVECLLKDRKGYRAGARGLSLLNLPKVLQSLFNKKVTTHLSRSKCRALRRARWSRFPPESALLPYPSAKYHQGFETHRGTWKSRKLYIRKSCKPENLHS